MESLGIKVIDINIGPIGDYYQFQTKEMDKEVGAIINIGSELTTVSVFDKGIIIQLGRSCAHRLIDAFMQLLLPFFEA